MKRFSMTHLKNFHLFVFLAVLFSCASQRKQAVRNEERMNTEIFQPTYNVSASTRRFIYQLEKELKESGKEIKEFTPSKKMKEDFSLRVIDGHYFISGFIKTKKDFNIQVFENTGVTFGGRSGNIITVHVPLNYVPVFLGLEGIDYLEISERVYTQ